MRSVIHHKLRDVVDHFQLEGRFLGAIPCGSGHINDTYVSSFHVGKNETHYIHQWINHKIFKEPEKLMDNIERVTRYTRDRVIAEGGDPERESLTLIPTDDGKWFYTSPEGDYWRTYVFIDGARTYDKVENLQHVYSASKAFGKFQTMLGGLPGERLHETIPNFHNTRKRFDDFTHSLENDPVNRAKFVDEEIKFVLQHEGETSIIVDLLSGGVIPERITHNDTKLNNVMIDDKTGEGICVIDLDTVMPGSALYDFGDSVRIGASTASEDEVDLSKVDLDLDLYELLTRGYLDATRDFLTPTEVNHMAFSGKLITLEQSIRFLNDYLNGDKYYRIHYPDHNLVRARTQMEMVIAMEAKLDQMITIMDRYK